MNEQQHIEFESAGAYALDALADDEARAFEAHLRICPACRAEVDELRRVTDILPLAVEPAEPSAGLRTRILDEVRTSTSAPALTVIAGDAPAASGERRPSPLRRPMAWISAVAAAVIIGLGAWNISLQQQVNQHPAPSVAVNYLSHGARGWPVAGTTLAPSAAGTLIQPKQGGNAILIFAGLPRPPADKVYQIWLMRGNSPTSGGTFSVSASGPQVFHLLHPATGYQLTAVTLEPAPRGSRGPTSKAVLFGKLGA